MSDQQINKLYVQLLEGIYYDSPLWKHIQEKELTCVPAFVGTEYENSRAKLMYVGRAVNGMDRYFDADSVECMVDQILNQPSILEDIVNPDGFPSDDIPSGKRKYYYKNSNFWKLLKFLLDEYGDSCGEDWYKDAEKTKWHQKIVWSNLYKVAPLAGGNPRWRMIKPQISTYIEIIKAEMDLYKPNHALFVTDNNFFIPWQDRESFRDILNDYTLVNDDPHIVGLGKYHDTKIIVCKRPDRRSIKIEEIKTMATKIHDSFQEME